LKPGLQHLHASVCLCSGVEGGGAGRASAPPKLLIW